MHYKVTEKQMKELTNFCNEIPTKYGMPLLSFIKWFGSVEPEMVEEEKKETKK